MISKERIQEIKQSVWFQNVRGKLEHIQRFLHDGCASAMVGAGFSFNAERDSSVRIKDWTGLAKDFYTRLYGKDPENEDLYLKSALRLASQVKCQYGRNELERIIENAIPNDQLKPGPLHLALLNLPWHDIFTTNYDQLLENTQKEFSLRYTYNIVTNKETLLYKSHPRIIKLHGSFPDIKPYIINEEDYRKYPDTHPEFVNTVRQSLIESALCLFGFSGEDPNFLNWIGWIRDKMGDHLAPIYLFDVSKNEYHESELSLLHERNVEIISLTKFPSNESNVIKEFFEFVFSFLGENPSDDKTEWSAKVPRDVVNDIRSALNNNQNSSNVNYIERTKIIIKTYKEIRESYPGWLFMPIEHLEEAFEDSFSYELDHIEPIISKLPYQERKELLYELEWRIRMSFTPVSLLPWFAKDVYDIIQGLSKEDIIKDYQLVVLCLSLMSYHRQRYETEAFEHISSILSDVPLTLHTENIRRFFYERCLYTISLMDYSTTRYILSLWAPAPEDYLGILWKSAIMVEIGYYEEANNLLIQTYNSLQNSSKTYHNIKFAYSTLGAYVSVIRALEPYSVKPHNNNKDIVNYYSYKYFRYVKGELFNEREKNVNNQDKFRTHEFNLNHVVNHYSIAPKNRDLESQYAGRIQMVWEAFGYPYLLNTITFNTNMMEMSSDSLVRTGNASFALNVLIRSAQSDTIKKVLSKSIVASLDLELVNRIFDTLIKIAELIKDWTNQPYGMRLVCAVTQILRRFCVVLDTERIKKLIPMFLKIREAKISDYNNDSLRTIFNCLSYSDLLEIYSLLTCTSIKAEDDERDIIFPNIDSQIKLPEQAIEIIAKGLEHENKFVRNNAYLRVAKIIHHCIAAQKEQLEELIIDWRNKFLDMQDGINAIYSFNVVSYKPDIDKFKPTELIDNAVNNLKIEREFEPDLEEDTIIIKGKTQDYIYVLEALAPQIPEENQDDVAIIIEKKLEKIVQSTAKSKTILEQAFGHQDKYELKTCSYIVTNLKLEKVENDHVKKLYHHFINLAELGYPKLYAIFKLKNIAKVLNQDDDFDLLLRKCVLSSDDAVRRNAFNFMAGFGFDNNKQIWKIIWDKIQFSSSPEVTDYLCLVMDTCESSPLNFENIPSSFDIPLWLNEIKDEEIGIDGDKFDLLYQVFRFLGYLKNVELPPENLKAINEFITQEIQYLNLPNDVKLGLEKGERIWNKLYSNNSNMCQCSN